jgi:hypothetical protein
MMITVWYHILNLGGADWLIAAWPVKRYDSAGPLVDLGPLISYPVLFCFVFLTNHALPHVFFPWSFLHSYYTIPIILFLALPCFLLQQLFLSRAHRQSNVWDFSFEKEGLQSYFPRAPCLTNNELSLFIGLFEDSVPVPCLWRLSSQLFPFLRSITVFRRRR